MALEIVSIRNIRNLSATVFHPDARVNLIAGDNGSGKTSILEALYILGRGRSFRESKTNAVLKKGAGWYEVSGTATTHGLTQRIGIRKSGRETLVKLNGTRIQKLSILAKELPIHVITPRSHELLEAGSNLRRRFVEWGVFHVKHSYQQLSARYHRTLAQRNAALKTQPGIHALWDREIVSLAESMDEIRSQFVDDLSRHLQTEIQALLGDVQVELEWRRGWDSALSLEEALDRSRDMDFKRGFTHAGPHRADLIVRMQGEQARKWASRGQQKLIICGLFLAQSRLINATSGKQMIMLVDDLAAELDAEHRRLLLERLVATGSQVFITSTDESLFTGHGVDQVFHVEHGSIHAEGV